MGGIAKLSLVVAMSALLVGASCARVSQKDQSPPRGEAGDIDRNASSSVPPAASSVLIPQPPTSNDVSAADATDSRRQSVGRPPGRAFGYVAVEIDLNSGDIRQTRAVADQPPQYDIYETGLSRELRRLGIFIPEQRHWVLTWRQPSGGMEAEVYYIYGQLFRKTLDLLRMLEEVNASDEQRRDVLQRLVTGWQDKGPVPVERMADVLIQEVGNAHGLRRPSIPYGSRIGELRYLGSE